MIDFEGDKLLLKYVELEYSKSHEDGLMMRRFRAVGA